MIVSGYGIPAFFVIDLPNDLLFFFYSLIGGGVMEKNARLADIYIRIYNKKPLLMDDLRFLYKYDPECFEKTCKNLLYKEPEAKKLLQPKAKGPGTENQAQRGDGGLKTENLPWPDGRILEPGNEAQPQEGEWHVENGVQPAEEGEEKSAGSREKIENLLENLKNMVHSESAVQVVKAEKVKELLGNLFMEMLFPHNDRDKYFQFKEEESGRSFNKQA